MAPSTFVVIIPAYQPGAEFPHLLAELVRLGATRIVVVDDGSGAAFQARFEDALQHPEVRVVRHAINLGKGAALKSGLNAILCDLPETPVVVTADADGQHHPEDIRAVRQAVTEHRDALILGARTFSGKAPLRSRLGNEATRVVMRIVAGQKLADTQTGLRAIPAALLPLLLKLPSQGYEFELDMLLLCHSKRVPVREVPIRTIYLDGNSSSHFNPLLDSMRIYFVLLRFGIISMGTAVLDNLIFSAVFLGTGSVLTSQIAGRAVAMVFNFTCVKRMVFNSRGRLLREFSQYTALVAVSGALSFGLIAFFVAYLSISVLKAKLLAEGILFLANFLVQRDLIFTSGGDAREVDAAPAAKAAAPSEADVRR